MKDRRMYTVSLKMGNLINIPMSSLEKAEPELFPMVNLQQIQIISVFRKYTRNLYWQELKKRIAYMSKPHVGTDKLIGIMKNIRKKIESLGGEYRFQNKLISIEYENNKISKA